MNLGAASKAIGAGVGVSLANAIWSVLLTVPFFMAMDPTAQESWKYLIYAVVTVVFTYASPANTGTGNG